MRVEVVRLMKDILSRVSPRPGACLRISVSFFFFFFFLSAFSSSSIYAIVFSIENIKTGKRLPLASTDRKHTPLQAAYQSPLANYSH